ncbi:MAG: P-loop NTPase [Desulfobacteraceae bacterium]|nr:P-loop NTPase [Desulfobacteraceae bacterium]
MTAHGEGGCEIWAIGGGKGGIGKSFLISCLGTALAGRGKRVVLVDADLGGANLHSLLGIGRPKASLTSFFEKKVPLAELVVATGIDHLGLLTGAIGSLDPDHIKYTQKLKFFGQIKKLDAEYVLIDLGAGTHFNTIDTFLLADRLLVVTVPEITAIENLYFFLKNTFFRKLVHACTEQGLKELLRKAWLDRRRHNIQNFIEFLAHLRGLSPRLERLIEEQLDTFTIQIVLNQVKLRQDIVIGHSIRSVCKKYYGLSSRYAGYVEHDDLVPRCINNRQSFMQAYPASRSAGQIELVADNVLTGGEVSL